MNSRPYLWTRLGSIPTLDLNRTPLLRCFAIVRNLVPVSKVVAQGCCLFKLHSSWLQKESSFWMIQESSVGKLLKENTSWQRCQNTGGWQGGGVGIRNTFLQRLKSRCWPLKRFLSDVLLVPNLARCPVWPGWWPESATQTTNVAFLFGIPCL